jgi:IS5 family transposase
MKPKIPHYDPNRDLLEIELIDLVDMNHSLCLLASITDWNELHDDLSEYFKNEGNPAKSVRLVVGLFYLKALFNLSDEEVVAGWVENPYWQYFCGEQYFKHTAPLHPTTLVKWRKRLGVKGMKRVSREVYSVALELGFLTPKDLGTVIVDTTVQEKAITYPTDSKLYFRMRDKLVKLAKRMGVELRQTYTRKAKHAYRLACSYGHAQQFKRMKAEVRKLKGYLGRVARDLSRKSKALGIESIELKALLEQAMVLMLQKKESKNKLYSLHAPEVECISKGKAHKRYEFGVKVSIITPLKKAFVLVSDALHGNPYDGHTLRDGLEAVEMLMGHKVTTTVADKGYRGHGIEDREIYISGQKRGVTNRIKKMLKRRSAIEPVIGHLKRGHCLSRNYLKGKVGDQINAIMAGVGFNLSQLWNFIKANPCKFSTA